MPRTSRAFLTITACLLTPMLSASCLHSSAADEHGQNPRGSAAEAERLLVTAKAKMMSADYRADLDDLARWREKVLPLADDPNVGYLAHYWTGFASWRIAINGASIGMSNKELKAHLERAAADFAASIQQRDGFADSYAAAAGVNTWLATFYGDDVPAIKEHIVLFRKLLARAKELAADNPRMLWVEASTYLFARPENRDTARAVEIYHRMAASAKAAGPTSSAQPDWGEPEALMSLAYTHLHQDVPDLAAAAEEARAALRLQPKWFYVRDLLMPQIEAARLKQDGTAR